ncbi:hypothetical protein TrVE_jg4412 [Triparma verrucosa]|uniref:Uncharacterized protein n=1 Tax=Triparma verrucosa TaxID=1606542 RepID=A0A9W7KSM3_9STRA|nr:hypothetical protein TrVE_jg4412 [Triparma verrucosa]
MDKKMPGALSAVQEAIDEFRQDDRIDAADREELSELMEEHWKEEVYSEGEQLLIDKGKATVKAITGSANLKALKSGNPLVTLKAAHLEGDKLITSIAESVVDGEMEEVAAFECLKMSRENSKNFHKEGRIKSVVKEVNSHSFYYLLRQDLKVPSFKHREWRSVVIWKKESEDNLC